MPELSQQENGRQGSGHAHSTSNSTNRRSANTQESTNKMRVGSATYYDIASALLGKGCTDDIDEVFLTAARDGDYERIEHFIQRRTDILVNIDVKDKRTGNTALIWAAKRGHTKSRVELYAPVKILSLIYRDSQFWDGGGNWTNMKTLDTIVQLLLKHGADITLRNYEGQTAVEIASPAIKTTLLDSVDRTTESSHRLLLQAAWQGNIKILKKLLTDNKVLDINCQNAEGLTPLLLASRDILQFERLSTQLNKPYNPVEVVTELLSYRADIHAVDEDGKTCLHYASQSKATIAQSVVQVLVTGGPNLDTRDKRCFTAIHCASQSGNVHCLEALLEGGSDVNIRGFAGTTPLHITAYNDHEKAAQCLLQHGADITLTDDRGLTALDLARGKKMKSKLKEAWADATKNKSQTDLAPIRTLSRDETRASMDGTKGRRRKSGDVIFEGLPDNPFENMHSNPPKNRPVSRHLSLKEKADKAEEMMMRDIENGNFTPGPYVKDGIRRLGLVRSQKPAPLPKTVSGSHERLPSISPDRLSTDRGTDSPDPFSRNGRYRRSLDEAKMTYTRAGSNPKLATFPCTNRSKKKVSPLPTQMSIPTDDLESVLQNSRLTPSSPTPNTSRKTKRHRRSGSDTLASPSLGDLALTCDNYLPHKGRSVYVSVQPLSQSEDYSNYSSPGATPRRTPLEREITQSSLSNYVYDRNNSNAAKLNLDRMGLVNKCQTPVQGVPLFPTSSKVLPPTPTFITQKTISFLDSGLIDEMSGKGDDSSKEPSPRSDEEAVKIAFGSNTELLRSRSILKEEFILEESRPKDLFIMQSSSSEDSARSKISSRGSESPKENLNPVAKQQSSIVKVPMQPNTNNKTVPNSGKSKGTNEKNTQCVKSGNIRVVERQNVVKNVQNSAESGNRTRGSASNKTNVLPGSGTGRDKITVHSSEVLGDVSDKNANNKSNPLQKNKTGAASSAKNKATTSEGNNVSKGDNNVEKSVQSKVQGNSQNKTVNNSKSGMQVVSNKLLSNVKEEIRKAKEERESDDKQKPQINKDDEEKSKNAETNNTKNVNVNISVSSSPNFSKSANDKSSANQNLDNKVMCKSMGSLPNDYNTDTKKSVLLSNKDVNGGQASRSSQPGMSGSGGPSRSSSVTRSSGGPIRNPLTSAESPRKSSSGTNYRVSRGSRSNSADRDGSSAVSKSSASSVSKPESGNQLQRSASGNKTNTNVKQPTSNTTTVPQQIHKSPSESNISKSNSGVRKSQLDNKSTIDIKTTKKSSAGISKSPSAGMTKSPSDGNITKTDSAGMRKSQSERELSGNHTKPNSRACSTNANSESGRKVKPETETKSVESLSSGKSRPLPMTAVQEQSKKSTAVYLKSEEITDSKSVNFQYKPASAGKPPLVEICPTGTPRTPRTSNSETIGTPASVPMQTPVIINPYEDMVNPYIQEVSNNSGTNIGVKNGKGIPATAYGYIVEKPGLERSKTQTSVKNRNIKSAKKSSKEVKPTSAGKTKQGVRRRGAKSKDSKTSDEGQRPTSGKNSKRVRSGRKKKQTSGDCALTKQASQSDVALISGIGWHVATACIDKSDVVAVKTVGFCSSSSSSGDEDDLLDKETPRNPNFLHVQIIDNEPSSNLSTPRFREVKQNSQEREKLPVMENDGFPPMNLDMTQNSVPLPFDLSKMLARESSNISLPSDFSNIFHNINKRKAASETNGETDDEENYTSTAEADEATAEIHRQILMGKLTPIPESPSLKSSVFLHKTMEAIELFDKNVKDETLNDLLGLNSVASPKTDLKKQTSAKTSNAESQFVQNRSANKAQSTSLSRQPSLPGSGNSNKSKEKNSPVAKDIKNGSATVKSDNSTQRTRRKASGETMSNRNSFDSTKDQEKGRNTDTVSGKSRKSKTDSLRDSANSLKTKTIEKQEKTETAVINVSSSINTSARDDLNTMPDKSELKFSIDLEKLDRDSEVKTTRRERKFSETKSEENKDQETENIDEVIEEILSHTYPTNSTLKGSRHHSVNSTMTDADKHLLLQLQSNNSPFHAKFASTPDKLEPESPDDLTAQNPTNPDLLRVFHADNFKIGQKMKAMIDAGADPEKVQAMIEIDNEAKQLAKIMNSFRNMELYTGPGSVKNTGKETYPKPERSSAEPSLGRKPPSGTQNRPGSAGGRLRLGKFTEIKKEKMTPRHDDTRQSTQRGEKHLRKSGTHQSTGIPVNDVTDEEIAAALRAATPENETIFSHIGTSQYESESRAGSACTTLSSQSSMEETIQWKKGNILGKGAFGTVWCGLTSEGQLIAVKQIELNTANKDKARKEYEKVQEEVELLKTLDHKNIVGYMGTSLEDSVVSIFMQFVPGGSIASILARFGALDEAVFRRYTRQILEGVEYLHANDVIHRDIKGGNVMLMPNGIIKLIDFGCAKRLCINLSMGQSQILKSMKGTPYWMAPEVVSETGHGKKSDIWSVGCTVFEMATRKPPWADMNPMAAIFAIGRADKPVPQLPEKFSPEAIQFVNACLTRDQTKRLTATELLQNVFIAKRKSRK